MTYKIERVVTQQPHLQYVTTEVTYNAIEQDTILDPLDVDTWVKLYRGFKYDYITCVRSTAPEVTIANQQAIADLLVLIQGITEEGSGIVVVQDEGVPVAAASNLNFVGDGVIAEIDPGDITGQTVMVTINGGQTFHGIAFPDLPIPEFSTEIGNDAYKYVVDDIDFMISDVDITIPAGDEGGENPDPIYPVEVIFSQFPTMPEGFTVRVTIEAFSGISAGVYFYNGSAFIGANDESYFPRDTRTTWIFQVRDSNLVLVSATTSALPGDPEFVITNPFVRYDNIQPINPTYQYNARTTIDAASNAYVAQVEAESMSRYPTVVRNNVFDTITTNDMYSGRGTAILQMDRAAPNTVTVSPIDFDDVGGFILYLTIVRAGNGVTTVDINSIGSPFHGAPPGGTYTLATKGDAITLMATRFWTGAEFIQYWQCIGRYQQAGSGGGGTEIQSIVVACSDETTALTTGVGKVTFRMPYAFTVSAVRASLTTAQASGTIFTVDINESGTTILSTKLTIDNTEKTSTTAATPPVISDTALADDAEITIDIDQIGDGTAKGLKITLIGTRA